MANESSQLRQEIRFGAQSSKLDFAAATATLQMKESMSVSDKVETTDDSMMSLGNASGDITTEGQFQPAEGELNWVPTVGSTSATCPENLVLSSIYNNLGTSDLSYSPGPIFPSLYSGQIVSPRKVQVMLGTVFSGEEFEAGSSQGLTEHKTKMMYSRAFDLETVKVVSVDDSGSNSVITLESSVDPQLDLFEPFNTAKAMEYQILQSDLSAVRVAAFDVKDSGSPVAAVTSPAESVANMIAVYSAKTITIEGNSAGVVAGDYFAPVDTSSSLIESSSYFQDNHSNLELFLNMRSDGTAMSESALLATTAVSFFDKVSYKFDNAIEFRGGFVGSSQTLMPFYTDSGNSLEGEIMLPLISSNSHLKASAATFNALDIVLRMTTGTKTLTYYIPDAHRKEVSSEIGSAYDGLTIPYKGQGLANTALCKVSKA